MTSTEKLTALHRMAQGRDHIDTFEFAWLLSRAPGTLRAMHCRAGNCYGIKPVKIGRSLFWSVSEVEHLLTHGNPGKSTRQGKAMPCLPTSLAEAGDWMAEAVDQPDQTGEQL
jgi:hypothetical protein